MIAPNARHREARPHPGPAGRPATARIPAQLTADSAELLRPETLELMRKIAASPAVEECPLNLSRREVENLLALLENRWAISRAWARSLELCLRYARMAQRLAERAGLKSYADWLGRRRIGPMIELHNELIAEPRPDPRVSGDQLAEAG